MYTALYRKWRPMTFDDVVSQPHITTTLSRQISEGKTAHAYLFTGSRGTGKTTCARIFAKAINCRNPHDGKPCLECDVCRAADSGTLNDIIEIDAASNTGVEDIRDLRESTVYTPEIAQYKVYIIDEVHMLSNQAFNALLKIMEEPPEHIKFILATTEIHKVPATIISRCQRFDFRRIRSEDITARLLYIAEKENVSLNEDAAAMIARISDGAMRDALSILDQCIAMGEANGAEITQETVSETAGIAGRDALFDILHGLAEKDATSVLKAVDMLYSRSKDMSRLCDELIFQLRNIMLIKTAPQNRELLNCLPNEVEQLVSLSESMTLNEIFNSLSILQSSQEVMQRAVSKRTELEMAVIKICSLSGYAKESVTNEDTAALVKRIAALENELTELKRNGISVKEKSSSSTRTNNSSPSISDNTMQAGGDIKKQQSAPITEDSLKPFPQWDEVLTRLTEVNPGCAGALRGSTGRYSGNTLLIEVQSEFFLGLFKRKENAMSLRDVVKEVTGQTYSLRARCVKEKPQASSEDKLSELIELAKKADIPFDIN